MMPRAVTCTLGLGLTLGVCCTNAPLVSERVELAKSPAPAINNAARPLSEIDLSQIGHIAPKGRVQDKDYNELAISDELIANGKDSIPFLISKLEDETVIDHHVIDYWPGPATVGDVAFVILTDFTTDSSWTKNTIRGADPDSILGKYDPNLPGVERLTRFVEKHGRKSIRQKWERIWNEEEDYIYWDEGERCFRVRDHFCAPFTIYDGDNH